MSLLGKCKHLYYRTLTGARDFLVVRNFREYAKNNQVENIPVKNISEDGIPEDDISAKSYFEIFLSPAKDFRYKDETWDPVRNLNELLLAASMHRNIDLEDNECKLPPKGRIEAGSLIIDTPELKNNWLCFFYNKNLPAEYVFGFDITIHSEFKEVQIAFRYKNLANRLRFLIRDNREAAFEIIRNGIFYRHVSSAPCSLQPGKMYHVAMEVRKKQYRFLIDGKPVIAVKQFFKTRFTGNQLCLILYNDTADAPVSCTVSGLFLNNDPRHKNESSRKI